MGFGSYVKDINDTVKSVFEGMTITFSHLVRRPMTISLTKTLERFGTALAKSRASGLG